jgi:biopolymer transport protein ExbD
MHQVTGMESYPPGILSKTIIMSAIETNQPSKPAGSNRIIKNNTRVDLTPMVDLGFLLITFFVFTTQLSLPTAMKLHLPYDKVAPADLVCASCQLTLLLQADNSVVYYEGLPGKDTELKKTSFANNGIRSVILRKKMEVQQTRGHENELVLIIKPTDQSNFQNFVDIVDEVTINHVKHYYIDGVSEADKKLLARK